MLRLLAFRLIEQPSRVPGSGLQLGRTGPLPQLAFNSRRDTAQIGWDNRDAGHT